MLSKLTTKKIMKLAGIDYGIPFLLDGYLHILVTPTKYSDDGYIQLAYIRGNVEQGYYWWTDYTYINTLIGKTIITLTKSQRKSLNLPDPTQYYNLGEGGDPGQVQVVIDYYKAHGKNK